MLEGRLVESFLRWWGERIPLLLAPHARTGRRQDDMSPIADRRFLDRHHHLREQDRATAFHRPVLTSLEALPEDALASRLPLC
jgi:hypothetical protein